MGPGSDPSQAPVGTQSPEAGPNLGTQTRKQSPTGAQNPEAVCGLRPHTVKGKPLLKFRMFEAEPKSGPQTLKQPSTGLRTQHWTQPWALSPHQSSPELFTGVNDLVQIHSGFEALDVSLQCNVSVWCLGESGQLRFGWKT